MHSFFINPSSYSGITLIYLLGSNELLQMETWPRRLDLFQQSYRCREDTLTRMLQLVHSVYKINDPK